MSHAPGHQKWPEHQVLESPAAGRMTVEFDGQPLADSRDVIRVSEDGHPPRFYFPREDVQMDRLHRTDTTTACPFKGEAHYFGLQAGSKAVEDLAWSYETPYDEHRALKGWLAFDETKSSKLTIRSLP